MKPRFLDSQVLEIRAAYAAGAGQKQLAFFWGCNRKSIQDIVHGRTYKAVGGPLSTPERICPECRQIVGKRVDQSGQKRA
jgi:hypothetical protein